MVLKRLCPNEGAQLTFLIIQVTSEQSGCAQRSALSPYLYAVSIFSEPV